jgi:hypothetical protein
VSIEGVNHGGVLYKSICEKSFLKELK